MEKKMKRGRRNITELYLMACLQSLFPFQPFAFVSFEANCDSISRRRYISEEKAPTEIRGRRAVQGGERRIEKPSWFRNNDNKKLHKMKQNENNKKKSKTMCKLLSYK